jgi:hypothetical protein
MRVEHLQIHTNPPDYAAVLELVGKLQHEAPQCLITVKGAAVCAYLHRLALGGNCCHGDHVSVAAFMGACSLSKQPGQGEHIPAHNRAAAAFNT